MPLVNYNGKGALYGAPKACSVRAKQEQCHREQHIELHLHRQAPAGVVAAAVGDLVVHKEEIPPAVLLTRLRIKRQRLVEEPSSVGKSDRNQ